MNTSVKNKIQKLFNLFSGGGYICLVLALFVSCNGFFSDNNLEEKIRAAIEYANAKSYDIRIDCDEVYGKIISGTNVSKKVSDKFNIEFKINSGVNFFGWKTYSKDNDNKLTELSEDYIAFSNSSFNDGVYKITATFVKASENIYIKPVCILLPAVTSYYPPYDNAGYPQDTSIKIYFNKSVNLSDFANDDGTLKNITIQTETQNLLKADETITEGSNGPFFKNPYLEDNGKTLVIPTTKGNYFIPQNGAEKDITVTLLLKDLKDAVEGENALFNVDQYEFVYRVNSRKDSSAPKITKFNVARTQEDAVNGTNLISVDEFTHYAAKANYNNDSSVVAANIKNHHVNKVWIYFEADDTQSGVESIELQEQFIRSINGDTAQGTIYDKNSNETTNYKINKTNSSTFSGLFNYEFKGLDDGVVRLSLIAKDRANNSITQSIDLVKDTRMLASPYVTRQYDESIILLDGSEQMEHIFEFFNAEKMKGSEDSFLKTYITDMEGNKYTESFFTRNENDFSDVCRIIDFEWHYEGEEENHIDLSNINFSVDHIETTSTYEYSSLDLGYAKKGTIKINVNPYKIVTYTITSCDTLGNQSSTSTTIPAIVDLAGGTVNRNTQTQEVQSWTFMSKSHVNNASCYLVYENESGIKTNPIVLKYEQTGESTKTSFSGITSWDYNKISIRKTDDPKNATNVRLNATLDNIGKGTYYIYMLFSIYNNNTASEAAALGGKPFVFYKTDEGFSEIEADRPQNSDVPDFTYSITNAGVNTQKLNVHIDWQEDFTFNPEFFYYIYDTKEYHAETDFFIECKPTVYLRVYVYNKKRQLKWGEQKIITITNENDTLPPSIEVDSYNSIYSQGFAKIKVSVNDSLSGIKTDDKGRPVIKVFTSSLNSIQDQIIWDNNPAVKEFYLDNNYIYYPVYGEYPGYIYFYVEDNAGNYYSSEYKYFFMNNINSKAKVEYIEDNIKLSIKAEPVETKYCDTICLNPQFINNNKWEEITNDEGTIIDIQADMVTAEKYVLSLTEKQKKSFIKISPAISFYSGSSYAWEYGQLTFFYPEYLIKKNTNEPLVCELKSFMVCEDDEIAILADKPCFAHTMYCPRNLGIKSDDWENIGMEAKVEMKLQSFTYIVPTDDIPDNYYYVTIIHFADGTVRMTDVKQK